MKMNMMMKDTLTLNDKKSLYVDKTQVGFFTTLFNSNDKFYSLAYEICFGYYTTRSAYKTVSPIYERIYEYLLDSLEVEVFPNDVITQTNILLGQFIRSKYIDKWTRIYSALFEQDYDVLKDYDYTEHKGADNSNTTTYNTNVEDNGKVGTKETTVTNRSNNNDIYGFNSSNPVGDSSSDENSTETVTGNADENTTHNTKLKTGTDTEVFNSSEDITRTSRNNTGADLINSELNMRDTKIFFDIIYKDIDSIATIPLYN